MLISTAIPYDSLVTFCRALRHGLAAGLSLVDVFRQQARKGPLQLRGRAGAVLARLEQGEGLEEALTAEGGRLPPLFHALAAVGEQTGHLPEVFRELEQYYALQSRLRKQFLAD